jgi:hypothetical protein
MARMRCEREIAAPRIDYAARGCYGPIRQAGRRHENPHHTRLRWSTVTRLPRIFSGGDFMEGEHTMRNLKTVFAVALAVGSMSSIAGAVDGTILATGVSTAADRLTLVDQVQFVFGGHKHCWYEEGWHGPGWYWCGYADDKHKGRGWGGPEGYRGWKH